MNYYVYYRLQPQDVDAARKKVATILDGIERKTGVRGRWMRRREDATTFMEVYEGVRDEHAFEMALAHEGARLDVERKVERFVSA